MKTFEFDIDRALDQFIAVPAQTDFQRGWLACLLSIISGNSDPRLPELVKQVGLFEASE